MIIEKGVLLYIESSDIKDGVLNIPNDVKKIADGCIWGFIDLKKFIATSVVSLGDDNFKKHDQSRL